MNFIPDSSSGLFGAMTLSITAISIMTVSITDLFATHTLATLSITSIRIEWRYAECHIFYFYAECHYAECRSCYETQICARLSVVMLNVIMPSVWAPKRPAKLSVVVLFISFVTGLA
jgi:hypothetical protein